MVTHFLHTYQSRYAAPRTAINLRKNITPRNAKNPLGVFAVFFLALSTFLNTGALESCAPVSIVASFGADKSILYFLDSDPTIENKYHASFDAGVMIFVLCEISSLETMGKVLRRVHDLLRPGANLVVLNPNWDKSNGKNFLTHEMQYASEMKLGGPVVTVLKGNPPIQVPDFYWSRETYLEILNKAGFGNFEIYEPLAPNDGNPWKDEKEYPPLLIIKAKK